MAVTAESLRVLHRIHRQLADLQDRLEQGPRQIKIREINVSKNSENRDKTHDTVQSTRMASDQKQLELKASEGKIADWKAKLNSCSSNKEYQTLLEQIAAAEMANSVLADEILESLERIDQLGVSAAQADQLLKSAEEELQKCCEAVAQEAEVIQRDVERLKLELAAEESHLPSDLKTDYRRVIDSKGAEGMSSVEGQVCLGCGQQITLNEQNSLLLEKPVFCGSCGCLLYLGET